MREKEGPGIHCLRMRQLRDTAVMNTIINYSCYINTLPLINVMTHSNHNSHMVKGLGSRLRSQLRGTALDMCALAQQLNFVVNT